MELEVTRFRRRPDFTKGILLVNGKVFGVTLEDEIREIKGRPVSEWKVYGKTAIPFGRYRIQLEFSNRFQKVLPRLKDVPGFSGILIHGGNTHHNTEGCILVGYKASEEGILGGTSRPAVEKLQELIKAAIDRGEEVWITIRGG